jgi:DNA-binding MarR family transcriptional regulator
MLASDSDIRPGKTRVNVRPTEEQASDMVIPNAAQAYMDWARLDENMTCRQVAILLVVRANHGASTGSIAKLLGLPAPVVTRAADKLEDLKLLHRAPHAIDKRLVMLMPGPAPAKKRGR